MGEGETEQLILFDLDNTLLSTNSSFRFGAYLYKHNIFPLSTMLFLVSCYSFHKAGLLTLESLHHTIFKRLFLGRLISNFRTQAVSFIADEFDSLLYRPAIGRLNEAKQAGHHIGILSSSPDFLVELIAQHLSVDRWMGTKYDVDGAGRFSMISELMNGTVKAHHLASLSRQLNIPHSAITAYSDSYLDRPFLEAAGVAVGVNPDKKLRRLCLKNQWKII